MNIVKMNLLLIDNNDSFTYNIVDILRNIDECAFEIINSAVLQVEELKRFSHIIISPGPMTPSDFPILNEVITYCLDHKTHLLGICLGHQAICTHFGGRLIQMDEVIHGQQRIFGTIKKSPLFENLPRSFPVGLYHSWTISKNKFPTDLNIIGQIDQLIMAVQHRSRPIYGVQFHPESFLTPCGQKILFNFLKQ